MALDAVRLRQQGAEFAGLLRRMALHGGVLFQTNRVFKALCLGTPCMIVCWALFGGGGGSATGTTPAPPPIIVGPNGVAGGATPYQFGSPQQSPDPASVQRQQVLAALDDSLRNEPRAGYRCEQLAAAGQTLTGQDRAQSLPQAVAAIGDADSCRALVAVSDSRFAALSQAATAFQAEESPANAVGLSRAGHAMIDFDRSRELADRSQGAFDAAQAATTLLQDSDRRLQGFADAERGMSMAPLLDAQTRLVGAAAALTRFDRPRLSPSQRATDQLAAELAGRFQESDRRIGKVIELGTAISSDISVDPTDLVDAVGALTDQDLQRASPAQKDALDHARTAARTAALDELVTVSPDPGKTLAPATDDRLTRMRRVIGTIDPASISPAQHAALDRADQAAARVRASEHRIADMRTAVDAWQKSPSPLAGNQVTAVYGIIGDYDGNRFTTADRAAFEQLENAFYVVSGKSLGLTPATRAKLPLFVVVRDAKGGPGDVLGMTIDNCLVSAGYHLAESRAGAAMIIEIAAAIDSQAVIQTPTASLPAALASATLRAFWSSDVSEFDREQAKVNSQGGTTAQAVNASFQRAGELLADRFDQFVKTGVKP